LLVAGGVAAGPKAAARARRLDPEAEITIVEQGEYVSYGACGLPYFLSGVVKDPRALLARSPEDFQKRQKIKVLTRHRVQAIDPGRKEAEVLSLAEGRSFSLPFDSLIIATGAAAVVPSIPGTDLEGVFALRTFAQGLAIKEFIGKVNPARAVVAGGGAIGLEAAEALATLGIKVALVEKAGRILANLDEDLSGVALNHLREKGVEVYTGEGLKRIKEKGKRAGGVLTEKREIPADLVLLAVGIRPEVEVARRAGAAIGPTGAIAVNQRMETSLPGVFAAGDCVELQHLVSRLPVWAPLGSTANKTGRVAGENAVGGSAVFPGVLGTSILKIFDLTAARTGLGGEESRSAGFDSSPTIIFERSRPRYYPGGSEYVLKLEVEQGEGRLLGAQSVGKEGVDKRIDILGTAIRFGARVEDLETLDLAYAPPYSPAVDGIITAAYVAGAKLRDGIRSVDLPRLKEMMKGEPKIQILDLRTPKEREAGAIPGAIPLTPDELEGKTGGLDKETTTVVFCQEGVRSPRAAARLQRAGWKRVFDLAGGFNLWFD